MDHAITIFGLNKKKGREEQKDLGFAGEKA
jgi:hypothetical protein